MIVEPRCSSSGKARSAVDIHTCGHPRRAEPVRHASRCSHEACRRRCGTHADEDAFACRPSRIDRVLSPVGEHVDVDTLSRSTQSELAKSEKIAPPKEALH